MIGAVSVIVQRDGSLCGRKLQTFMVTCANTELNVCVIWQKLSLKSNQKNALQT